MAKGAFTEQVQRAASQAQMASAGSADIATLTALFDCDARQISVLVKKGVVLKTARDRYNVAVSTRNYIKWLREQAAGRQSRDGGIDAVKENALFKRSQRELNDAKLAQLRGELLTKSEILELWGDVMLAAKQMILAIPSRVAAELPHLTPHDREVLKRACNEVLRANTLATGYPPMPERIPREGS